MTEWLSIADAVIAHKLTPEDGKCLEIGTWKGGWILSLLSNHSQRMGVGIDPYPNLDYIRDYFLEKCRIIAPRRVTLFDSIESFNQSTLKDLYFDVIHLDGEHSQKAIERDFLFAVNCLNKKGIIIVDDIFYHDYPGVTAGLFNQLPNSGLSPFLFSEKKLYLCRKQDYAEFYSRTRLLMDHLQVPFLEDQIITKNPGPYFQSNSINGFSLLVINTFQFNQSKLVRLLGLREKFSVKRLIISWCPPIIITKYRRWRNST